MDFARINKCLHSIEVECSEEGWDGYCADPIRPEAVHRVSDFLIGLEHGLPTPDISPVPDGNVDMVWEAEDGRYLMVFWEDAISGWNYIFHEVENDPWQSGPDGLEEKLDLFRQPRRYQSAARQFLTRAIAKTETTIEKMKEINPKLFGD